MSDENTNNPTDTPSTNQPEAPKSYYADRFLSQTPEAVPSAPVQETIPQTLNTPAQVVPPTVVTESQTLAQPNTGLVPETVTPPVTTPPAENALPDLNFSFDLPDAIVSPAAPVTPVTTDVSTPAAPVTQTELSKLVTFTEETPEWQKEALSRLESDNEIPNQDKELIVKLNPSYWEKARTWQKASSIVSKFTNATVPIEEAYNQLKNKSENRTRELETLVISKAVESPEELARFATSQPKLYQQLMLGLANSSEETVKAILQSRGYKIEKADETPIGDDVLKDLEENHSDDWNLVKGTPVEDMVKKILERDAERERKFQTVSKTVEAPVETPLVNETDVQYTTEQQGAFRDISTGWNQDYMKGLQAVGITPPTPEQFKANPQAGLLRELAFTVAVEGMGAKLPNWMEQFYKWGENKPEFKEIDSSVSNMISEKKVAEAVSLSRAAASTVYQFASLRAQTPAIQAILALAKQLEAVKPTAPPAADPKLPEVPNSNLPNNQQNGGERKFIADKYLHQ